MNGSSIFLFAAFKMKLKMAARRALARALNREPNPNGPLSDAEEHAFRSLLERFLDLIEFHGPARAAAVATSARRDDPQSAALLAATFAEIGRPIAETARAASGLGARASLR
jgi:exopolyphosphatase/pppGpp-phosphohydrolase